MHPVSGTDWAHVASEVNSQTFEGALWGRSITTEDSKGRQSIQGQTFTFHSTALQDTATVCRRIRENKSREAGNCGSCLSAGDKVEIPGALLGKDIKTQERRVIHCRDFYVRHTYLSTTFILINVF